MLHEENRLKRKRLNRIARVKRVLRWMPRRTNVHRYPVLKWFAKATHKRSYLWSFRVKPSVRALYAGFILALLPIYGLQIPIAVGFAFLLRANLPLLFSLQFIANPLTILPLYYTCFQIARVILHVAGFSPPHLTMGDMKLLIEALQEGKWALNLKYLASVWSITCMGGIILGTFLATVSSAIYKLAAYEVSISYRRLVALQAKRQAEQNNENE